MLVVPLVAAVSIPVAQARASGKKAAIKKAKFHWGLGAKFFKNGKYPEALAEMRKANLAIPLPATVFNMARCYQEMGQYAEAVEYFQQYMEEGDNKKKLKRTEEALAELIPKAFGSVEITCDPAGANVQIAGIGAGPCPFVKEQVRAGKWIVIASAQGHTDARQQMTILPGERNKVALTLKRPGLLSVTTEPAGAKVYLDGKLSGESPLDKVELPEGAHALGVVMDGFREDKRTVEIPGGDSIKLAIKLERRGGALKLTSAPVGASIFVDGTEVGSTPLKGFHLDEGDHKLRVEKGMHVSWARAVEIKDQQALELHAELPSKLPTWLAAGAAGLAAVGGAVALLSAQGAYTDRDDVVGTYELSENADEAQRLGDEVRSLESSGDTMFVVSQALFGVALAAGGAAGWLWFSTPDQVSARGLR